MKSNELYCLHMRDAAIIAGICGISVLVGAGLFFFGPEAFRTVPERTSEASGSALDVSGQAAVSVLSEGAYAPISERKNYVFRTQEEFQTFWTNTFGIDATAPYVDFAEQQVIAVFAGERSTGGYRINVDSVSDQGGVRTVTITLTEPGDTCIVTQATSAPYQFVLAPKTILPLAKNERTEMLVCN